MGQHDLCSKELKVINDMFIIDYCVDGRWKDQNLCIKKG